MKKHLIASLNTYELEQRNDLTSKASELAKIADANAGIISNLRAKLEQLDGEPDADSQFKIDAAFNQIFIAVDNIDHAVEEMQAVLEALNQSTPLIEMSAEPIAAQAEPIVDDADTDFDPDDVL